MGKENLGLPIDILTKDVKTKVCLSEDDTFGNMDIAKDTLCVMCYCWPGTSLSEKASAHPTSGLLEEYLTAQEH